MTTDSGFLRDLPTILEDLYLGPSPDYRDEALAVVRRTRQRPSWTFAGRWLPMADIASRSMLAPRVPWRTVGLALLVIALVLAAAILVVGSRQTRVPPPFGLARNGLIAYAIDGDILTVDPVTGRTAPVVTGPEDDFDPVFSPDGTRIVFRRSVNVDGSPAEQLVVVNADGSNAVVATSTLDAQPGYAEWAPDSRSLLVEEPNGAAIWLLDATSAAEPRLLASDASTFLRPFRPPKGDELLIQRSTQAANQVVLLDIASGEETILVSNQGGSELSMARWSPTGDRVLYVIQPPGEPDIRRVEMINADGSGEPVAVPGIGRNTFDMDAAWSNDGSRIAFIRWEQIEGDTWDVRPITVYSVADGTVSEVGPRPRDIRESHPTADDAIASAGEGYYLEFSPDGTKLLAVPSEASGHPVVVDLVAGEWEVLDMVMKPGIAANVWQRLAAP